MIAYAESVFSSPKGDQFVKRFDDKPIAGRTFKATVIFDEHDSSLHYRYDAEKEKLTVWATLGSNFHVGAGYGPKLDYLILAQTKEFGTPITMSNAFGVSKAVTPMQIRTYAIGNRSDTYIGLFPKESYSSNNHLFYGDLKKIIAISPERGKAAVDGLAMDIEGVIAAGKDGHTVVCDNHKISAKIDYPYQETWDECVILVKLTRVAIHSPLLGVMAEWVGPALASKTALRKKS